jgi:hypothetical protein
MITFVKDVEPLLEKNQNQYVSVDERRVSQIVRGFATDWKRGIESINHDIMRSFSNLKNGTAILQVTRITDLELIDLDLLTVLR